MAELMAVKIRRFKVKKAGSRGLQVSLPQVWVDDVGLTRADSIDFYRDQQDRLIIVKADPIQGRA